MRESEKCNFCVQNCISMITSLSMDYATAIVISIVTVTVGMTLFKRSSTFKPNLKHAYIGGGSEGLGLSLACQLVALGAHVSIVSRSADKLAIALETIQVRPFPSQPLNRVSPHRSHRHTAFHQHRSSKPIPAISQTP